MKSVKTPVRRLLALLAFAALATGALEASAAGWYWVRGVPHGGDAIEAFDAASECEAARAREKRRIDDDAQRIKKRLSLEQQMAIWLLTSPKPEDQALYQSLGKERGYDHDPLINEAAATILAHAEIGMSACVASDDPRLQASNALWAPSLPPAVVKAPTSRRSTIPYRRRRAILATVKLNGRVSVRLIVDTGADGSIIRPGQLLAAGVDMARPVARGEIRGVAGTAEALYFLVDSLEVGGARAERLRVAAFDIGENEADGLLGRDFLDRFNVSIEPRSGTVRLTPK